MYSFIITLEDTYMDYRYLLFNKDIFFNFFFQENG